MLVWCARGRQSVMRVVASCLVMLLQQIAAKILFVISPYGMNVVRVVLSIVILNEERCCLNAVVVWLPLADHSCPCEMHVVTRLFHHVHPLSRKLGRHI